MTTTKQTKATVVIEPESSLVLTQVQPGLAIVGNFEALKAYVDKCVSDYVGVVVTDDYVPQAKHDRAALNALVKTIDARRLEVKREYMAPVTEFEDAIKLILAPAKEASLAIDVQIKDFEERERVAKRAELVKHFEEYAPALTGLVTFERIEDPKWALKSTNLMAAFEDIEERVGKIASDYETLLGLELAYPEDARETFFATLDFGKAVARSKEIEERKAAAAKLEADRAAYAAEQEAARVAEVARVEEVMARTEPFVPEPAPIADAMTAEYGNPGDLCAADVPAALGECLPVEPNDPATPIIEMQDWTFVFHCTAEKAKAIADFATSLGVHGKAVRS